LLYYYFIVTICRSRHREDSESVGLRSFVNGQIHFPHFPNRLRRRILPSGMEQRPMFDEKNPPLVPGRECGDCNVCCVDMTIDDPALRKPQGVRCHNALPDNRCIIYETRPQTCRHFFCGWRMLKWIKPGLRPDTSGVLVTLTFANKTSPQAGMGVMFTLLRKDALKSEGLAETIAAAVAAGAPVHIRIPGPPGYTSASARIDEVLRPAVLTRDKAAVLRWLRRAWREGHKGDFEKIELSGPPSAPTTT
jgi:hypothetical protein